MERIPVIKTSDLSIEVYIERRTEKRVHDALDLNLYPGEVTCLLGLNGAEEVYLIEDIMWFSTSSGREIELMGSR